MDAGSGIRGLGAKIARERSAAQQDPAVGHEDIHLFLTHQHFDHIVGLPHFQPLRLENSRIILRCGNASSEALQELVRLMLAPPLFVAMPTVSNTLRVDACEPSVPLDIGGGCTVTPISARHNGGAAIFRVNDAHGPAIAFAPDNELSYANSAPEVTEWRRHTVEALRDVRILLHDAMYSDKELARYSGWGHSSAEEATQLAIECNAQRLVLFHHHPDRTDTDVDDLVWNCRSLAHRAGSKLQIDAAYEGMTLTV
jgi:ribonuclease BN (tRNA processing enzyme)